MCLILCLLKISANAFGGQPAAWKAPIPTTLRSPSSNPTPRAFPHPATKPSPTTHFSPAPRISPRASPKPLPKPLPKPQPKPKKKSKKSASVSLEAFWGVEYMQPSPPTPLSPPTVPVPALPVPVPTPAVPVPIQSPAAPTPALPPPLVVLAQSLSTLWRAEDIVRRTPLCLPFDYCLRGCASLASL